MITALLTSAAAIAGCGSDDDVDSIRLKDLNAADAKAVCQDLAATFPSRTVTCGPAMFPLGYSSSGCASPAAVPDSCNATVGEARKCANAFATLTDAQICTLPESGPAECAPLQGCNLSQ
jgi:hypothetical protein